jgi:hypothetical protein
LTASNVLLVEFSIRPRTSDAMDDEEVCDVPDRGVRVIEQVCDRKPAMGNHGPDPGAGQAEERQDGNDVLVHALPRSLPASSPPDADYSIAVRAPDPLGAGTVVQIDNAEPRGVRLPIRLVSVRNAQVHCVDSPVIGQGDDLGRFDEAEVFASSKELRPVSA